MTQYNGFVHLTTESQTNRVNKIFVICYHCKGTCTVAPHQRPPRGLGFSLLPLSIVDRDVPYTTCALHA